MEEEIKSLWKNETWDMVAPPNGKKLVHSKWVFNKKLNATSQAEKYKDRLVAKGYFQVQGVDFGDIFSRVAKITSIRVVMYLTTTFNVDIEQMDVKT